MNFGLGLILNFTDNASTGILGVTSAFNNMSNSASSSMSKIAGLGGALTAGLTMPIVALTKKLWDYGVARASFTENARIAFTSLLEDANAASQHLSNLMEFAKQTPFRFDGITAVSQKLVGVGMDANKTINIIQKLGDTAGSLGESFSFVDRVSDILAKIQSMGEVTGRELRSLQLAGLGRYFDDSAKGMSSVEFFDLLEEKLKVNDGLMANIKGTWTGALDSFTSALTNAGQEMLGLKYNAETFSWEGKGLETMTKALNQITSMINNTRSVWVGMGDFVLNIVTKIGNAAEKLGNWYKGLDENSQKFIGKLLVIITLLGPGLMLFGKLGGAVGKLLTAFISLSPWLLAIGAGFLIWKNDLGGVRTAVETFVNSFKTAREYVSMGCADMMNALNGLDQSTFGGKLVYNMVKLWTLINILREGFTNLKNDGVFWLGKENYDKMQALGLQDLVENIVILQQRLSLAWDGFKQGLEDFINFFKEKFKGFGEFMSTHFNISFEGFSNFLDMGNKLEPEKWENFGRVLGIVAASLAGLFVVNKVTGAIGGIGKLFSLFGGKGSDAVGSAGGGILKILGDPKTILKAMGSLGIIIGGFAVIVAAFAGLSKIPGFAEFMGKGIETLGQLIKGMNVLMSVDLLILTGALALMGMLSPAIFLSGMASLAVIIGGFALIISAFGLLSMIPGFNEFISSGGKTLALVAEQIGLFISSFVGGIGEGLTNSLPIIGENLGQFGKNIQPFFEAVQNAPLDQLGEFLLTFGGFMLMLGGNEILSFITGGVDLPSLGSDLSKFGNSAKEFFDIVAKYDDEDIKKSGRVFEALAGMGENAFRFGGIAQIIKGNTHLDTLGEQLAKFAPNGKIFFDTMKDVEQLGIDNGKQALESLSLIGSVDFNSGGILGWIIGKKDLKGLGEQLKSFGEEAKGFFTIMKDFSTEDIEKGRLALDVLTMLGANEFKDGGLLQAIIGHNDIAFVGLQLSLFADAVKPFFDYVKTVDPLTPDKVKSVLESLSDVGVVVKAASSMYNSQLGALGTGLSEFMTNSQDFFILAATTDTGGVAGVTTALKGLFDAILGFKTKSLLEVSTGLENLKNAIMKMPDAVNSAALGVTNNTPLLTSAFEGLTSSCSTILNSFAEIGETIGRQFMQNLTNGINNNAHSIEAALQKAINGMGISLNSGGLNASLGSVYVTRNTVPFMATGGYVESEGLAQLHPAEVVLNDNLTSNLGSFLNDRGYPVRQSPGVSVPQTDQRDTYQINFEEGSLTVKIDRGTPEEAKRFADMVYGEIKRKKDIENMMSYKDLL